MHFLFCIFFANCHYPATLTEVLPCFFLNCMANDRVYFAKTGHGPHSPQFVNFVLLCIVCREMSTVLLPPGVNPIAATCISYHIISYYIKLKLTLSYEIIKYVAVSLIECGQQMSVKLIKRRV